ncbi:MAG TPA: LEA type 2 family protein [Steroidobacteraceae bacterium]|nr:LEA type 2 family protein [Steroidobacteraceae bacterium]
MRRGIAACAAGALLASGSCALAPKLVPPELSIVGVQLLGSDLFAQRLKVRVHVRNPNNRVLPVDGLEYTLEVDGQPFATGESAASFVVPALGAADFDMNVTTNVAGTLLRLLARAADARGPGVPYRLYGKVTLSSGWVRSLPFEERGRFDLQ